MADVSRRAVLMAGVGGLALLSAGGGAACGSIAGRSLERSAAARAHSIAGTTLEQTASASASPGYRRLVAGPGYPLIVREELVAAHSRRDDTRTAIASIVQFTDLHIIDAQSPMRLEFLAASCPPFFRPQEALGTQAAAQLVARVNRLATGPFSGRPFDCVVATGDNSDNNETLELDWFLRVMNGGSITPNSGAVDLWEGVQNTGDRLYYNPELAVRDRYKKKGFPRVEGFFDRVMREHVSEGLEVPWYSVFGNHDDSIGGSIPSTWMSLEELYTGTTKFTGFTSRRANATFAAAFSPNRPSGLADDARADTAWQVTADARRTPFSSAEFMAAHLEPGALGAGPVGHGFTREAVEADVTYYTFPLAPGVTGVSLDSTNRAGWARGSIGDVQLAWLERVLTAGSSTFYEADGTRSTRAADDTMFVVFSHHSSGSMTAVAPDPRNPLEERHLGGELVTLLQRFPNVLAWVNGHTHSNSITPRPGATPERGFWEINTASHVDFPQQARIIEVCDNRDGTLSLFTTLIESTAPYRAAYDDGSQASLASLYRELSLNDLSYSTWHEGRPTDHNTELLLPHPFA